MIRRRLHRLLLLLSCLTLASGADLPSAGQPGPYPVETLDGVWIDEDREGRDVPWRLFLPAAIDEPAPVVVFSPGGGGSRDDAAGYLGRHLASHGVASFHLQHRGSDADALKSLGAPALFKTIVESKPSWAVLRQQDIQFAVDHIELLARGDLKQRIDAERLGMSGFSFGAVTTLITAGQTFPGLGQTLAEPRFRAAFALSPSARHGIAAPVLTRTEAAAVYDKMLMPLFHLTGTRDETPPPSKTTPEHRQMPFHLIQNVDQYLLVLNNAVHRTFSGNSMDYPEIERHHELIKTAYVAFWRAYLLDDTEARDWLQLGGYRQTVGPDGSFEFKPSRRHTAGFNADSHTSETPSPTTTSIR